MNRPLSEMTVLITGASRGIGAAVAKRFSTIGMNIVIHYLHAHEQANETARYCLNQGSRVMTVTADLRSREQLTRMKEKLDISGFFPDVVVNNGALSYYGMINDIDDEQWDDAFAVNVRGMFICTQLFLPRMIERKYGRIINLSSVWGHTGASCESLYAATKGAVNAFTKSLAKELAPSGVTVNAVSPGVVETEMNAQFNPDEKQDLTNHIPAGRFALPEEIASLVYFLALPESSYITGQLISPNGGWMT